MQSSQPEHNILIFLLTQESPVLSLDASRVCSACPNLAVPLGLFALASGGLLNDWMWSLAWMALFLGASLGVVLVRE